MINYDENNLNTYLKIVLLFFVLGKHSSLAETHEETIAVYVLWKLFGLLIKILII